MKKKGSRKKVNSSKRKKKFFFFKWKLSTFVLTFVFLALVILLPFMTTGNAVNTTVTGQVSQSFLDNTPSISGPWWDAVNNWLSIGNTWRDIIVYIVVLLILFVMLYDILLLTSIFSGFASFVIALGMSVIAALTNIIRQVSVWFITIAATMGIAAGFLEIGIAIIIFVGLVFGSSQIAIWAAKRRAQKEEIMAIKGAGQAGAAIRGLKMIQKRFKYKP